MRENKSWGHGAKLRKARKLRGMTLQSAAREAGISTMRASELERMPVIATSPAAVAYAKLFGFSIQRHVRLVRTATEAEAA